MEMIKVYIIDLPHRIHGLTIYYFDDDGQGYYTILLNARLSNEMQCEAYDHEIDHINNNDFDNMYHISELEALRHDIAV